jgi:hypothetical protein
MVRGWIENLISAQLVQFPNLQVPKEETTYNENIIPHNLVLKTTSIVPQVFPVNTYKSPAKVIPGSKLVKKT